MTFRKELTGIDLERVGQVFEDIFPSDREDHSSREEHENFMLQEMAVASGQFPVFGEIQARFNEMAPRMLRDGVISEEQTHGVLMGFTIVTLVMAGYAERELPDTLPPDLV